MSPGRHHAREIVCSMKKKALWTAPFGFRENFLIVFGLFCVGTALQYAAGCFDVYLLCRPVNYYVFGFVCLSCFLLSKGKNAVSRWLASLPLAVCLMAAMLFLAGIMGVVPQVQGHASAEPDWADRLGLTSAVKSWQFVLCYVLLVFSLGTLTFGRLTAWNKKNVFFFMNHGGLFLVLLGAGLGAGDMQRFVMHVYEKQTEWRVYGEAGEALELPFAIHLNDFAMEYYPPRLALIDRKTGDVLPKEKPQFFQLAANGLQEGFLGNWHINVLTYYHKAVWAGNGEYKESGMTGSSPAARITTTDRRTGQSKTGWVTAGNLSRFVSALYLDDGTACVMTKTEPKRFLSDIEVMTRDGQKIRTVLEVNRPLRIGSWTVYQYGYEEKLGNMSPYSSFELVYDPWLNVVYLGFVMLCIGSFFMIWLGKKEI